MSSIAIELTSQVPASRARQRAACDECRAKKLKCTGEQPECRRCHMEGASCIYSTQKTMGRPKKLRRNNDQDETTRQNAIDAAHVTTGLKDLPLSVSGFQTTSFPPCVCLSSLYLSLSSLSTAPSFPLSSSLAMLRNGLGTAQAALHCAVCPTRFMTGVQNTQVLSTLLVSLATAYAMLLTEIDARLMGSERTEAKLVVHAEVWGNHSPSLAVYDVASTSTLMSLVNDLQARQARRHEQCADSGEATIDAREPGEQDHLCQKMANMAGVMVEAFDWS